jgi:hypothetical protein
MKWGLFAAGLALLMMGATSVNTTPNNHSFSLETPQGVNYFVLTGGR